MAGSIGGDTSLVKTGPGTLRIDSNNAYTGTTTISEGTLQIGSGSTTGTLGSGAVTNNGTLIFDRSNAMTVANTISGSGSLTQAGTNTVTLTGRQQLWHHHG
jgi:fibronectin-binding autotransporter adhesin